MKCAMSFAVTRLLKTALTVAIIVFLFASSGVFAQTGRVSAQPPRQCASVDFILDTDRPSALIEEGQTLATVRGIFASINARPAIDPERAIIIDLGAFMAVHFVRGQVACLVMLTNSRNLRALAFPLRV